MNATVVKVGGSLAAYPEKLRALCVRLSEASEKHKLVILPGGGEFADTVRVLDKRFSLSGSASHRMAILAMDQYGLLLSDLTPNSSTVETLKELEGVLGLGKVPVFLPSRLLFNEDKLENSWDVTSDAIAVYLAGKLQVPKVLLVTDVDGIYTDNPKTNADAELIKKISPEQLSLIGKRTSVDVFLPKMLFNLPVDCFVVNGLFPERVESLLAMQEAVCTLITRK
jgi:5-(aminomethyl)-3-furanmethanol phosphate kinase